MTAFVKNGVTIIGFIIIAALGYYLFVVNKDSGLEQGTRAEFNEAQLASEEFLRDLRVIQSFELSNALFSDPRFQSFVDFTKPLQSQTIGRDNPFEPVE